MNLSNMTPKDLAGQRLMVGFNGHEFNDDIRFLIQELRVGGLILFSRNIDTKDQVRTLTAQAQAFAKDCGLPRLFIAVDQEGGVVARFREGFTRFRGNPFVKTLEQAGEFARVTSDELGAVGVNMNMAPVMDVAFEPDSIMIERAFPGGPATVAELGCQVISTLQANGMMAVAKHFPGIGRTVLDSHFELPVLNAAPSVLMENDLVPFMAAKDHQVTGIMLSHILYEQLDSQWPASLSPA
ncbi:MAG: beta-N-acetylhexosaminidase, partial [Desulfobacteraceae bacterium]